MNLKAIYLRKKYWFTDFLNGMRMWKQYKDVMLIMNNNDYSEKARKRYLNNLLDFAIKNVPYYSQNVKQYKNLQDFPIVNKQIYLKNYNEFCTPVDKIPFQEGKLHIQHTSGSTGTPFDVPQDTLCRLRRIAIIKAENEIIGFHSFEPMMHLRAVAHYWNDKRDLILNKKLNIWYVDNANLKDDKIKKIIEIINKNKIKVIRGYMTSLDTITKYMEDNKILFNHKITFISVGELLLDRLSNRVKEYLKCNIISQYASEEIGIFGQSEINGSGRNINLNNAGCIVEILKMDCDKPADIGERGRIVVTDFTNYAFPMIRYEMGDIAAPQKYNKDGTIKSICKLSGRITDLIYCTNGHSIDLLNSLPREIQNNKSIIQFQFIQHDSKKYTLRLCIENKEITKKEYEFIQKLKNILGEDAEVKIEWINEIPVLSSGKRKVIINEWKKNSNNS